MLKGFKKRLRQLCFSLFIYKKKQKFVSFIDLDPHHSVSAHPLCPVPHSCIASSTVFNVKPLSEMEYIFHFCVQDPDIEGLVEKILAHGGKKRMPIREYYPNDKPYKMVYVEDPFGNIFEIYTYSYEMTYSQRAY
ncbi:VOC family protein [Jeotgalibacillus campisalis]|nr:VOC family protein [Jeotgalibacillus campisalis]